MEAAAQQGNLDVDALGQASSLPTLLVLLQVPSARKAAVRPSVREYGPEKRLRKRSARSVSLYVAGANTSLDAVGRSGLSAAGCGGAWL